MYSTDGLPRDNALPTTTVSGAGCRCPADQPSCNAMPSARNWSLIGGYTFASEPSTSMPSSRASAAMPPMKVPQMPRMWMRIVLQPSDNAHCRGHQAGDEPVDHEQQQQHQHRARDGNLERAAQDADEHAELPDDQRDHAGNGQRL